MGLKPAPRSFVPLLGYPVREDAADKVYCARLSPRLRAQWVCTRSTYMCLHLSWVLRNR